MATPEPETREILAALDESELTAIALRAAATIDALPQRPVESIDERVAAVDEQLRALREDVLEPLKRERDLLGKLPQLAQQLGLSSTVKLLVPPKSPADRRVQLVDLTAVKRDQAFEHFLRTLNQAIELAAVEVRRRGGIDL